MDLDLEEEDVEWIITQLDMYGMADFYRSYDEDVEKKNQKLIKVLKRGIIKYPKEYLISPPIKYC